MEYRSLGTTGMEVSRLGLGGAAQGGVYGHTDTQEACRVVSAALEAGINYIDTAPWYGNGRSEQVLGKALEGVPRDRYFLATKACRYKPQVNRMFDFTAPRTLDSVDCSLQRLGLEYVDIIQVHDLEYAPSLDIIVNETLPALQKVKDAGKARFIGITGYPTEELKKVIERSPVKIDTVLSYCHLCMHDSSLLDHLNYFKEKGIGVISGSPLSMGLLTHPGPPPWHPAPDNVKQACAQAATFCEGRGVNFSHLAMNYALGFEAIPVTLTSAGTVDILRRNLDTLEKGLTPQEEDTLEQVMARYMRPLKNSSWGRKRVDNYWRQLKEKTS